MNKFFVCILAVWASAIPTYAQEQVTAKWNDPSRPGLLKVDWRNGSVIVKTHNTSDVTISTKNGINPRPVPPEAGGLRRIDSGSRGFVVDSETNNVITISGPGSIGGNLEIEVPAQTNLNLESHNGATITVDGVQGDIEATNHNGAVELMNVAGSVVAYSHNGKVIVSLRDVAAGKPMSFTSMNGNVDVTLPPPAKANLKMRTDNGAIYTDFDVQVKPGTTSTSTSSDRTGRVRIEVDKTINGTINGGGADFDLRTHNGNIFLRKGK